MLYLWIGITNLECDKVIRFVKIIIFRRKVITINNVSEYSNYFFLLYSKKWTNKVIDYFSKQLNNKTYNNLLKNLN